MNFELKTLETGGTSDKQEEEMVRMERKEENKVGMVQTRKELSEQGKGWREVRAFERYRLLSRRREPQPSNQRRGPVREGEGGTVTTGGKEVTGSSVQAAGDRLWRLVRVGGRGIINFGDANNGRFVIS